MASQPLPHTYVATAAGGPEGSVTVASEGLPSLATAAPAEFGGPGDRWSPETLLIASVADCFLLTFRAISRASRLEWQDLQCRVDGVLERLEGVAQFTRFSTRVVLTLAPGMDATKARLLLEKAEHGCLVANSLRGQRTLDAEVRQA